MAGDQFDVQVTGLRELRAAIRRTENTELSKGLKEVHKETANVVARPARADAPVVSGRLARSVKPSASARGAIVRAGSGKSAEYAGPIHFGWRKRRIVAQPFIFDAAGRKHDEYSDLFFERMSALVRRFVGTK